ncbi:EamA family transporter [Scopulibacillus cellulosilyticus]|uniref:EamA family transporter n=1 Tax=Scopulibacillus cellulosilyticus TaxID=2665665 RepID=A0ABW2PSJ1_9BACL
MSVIALILVLISSVIHATWNLLSKKAEGGYIFVWLFTFLGAVFYTPFVIILILWMHPHFKMIDWVFIIGSALIHLLYFMTLQKGYAKSDFSIVYPIARGIGPIIATIIAVIVYHEKPSPFVILGTIIIVFSVFMMSGGIKLLKGHVDIVGVLYGVIVGLCIGTYTTWDKYAVGFLLLSPIIYDYFCTLFRFVFLTPSAITKKEKVKSIWHQYKWQAFTVGILNSLAYILVLTALSIAPVSYIAPLREIGILIGTLFGVYFLKESYGKKQILLAGFMVVGVICIAISE